MSEASLSTRAVMTALCSTQSLLIMSVNGLVIYCIATVPFENGIHTSFYLSLAIGDFSIGAIVIPYLILTNLLGRSLAQTAGVLLCRAAVGMSALFMFVSILNLAGITFGYCIAIIFPLHVHRIFQRKSVSRLIVTLWLISAVLSLGPFPMMLKNEDKEDHDGLFCQVNRTVTGKYIVYICSVALLPVMAMLAALFVMFKVARAQSRKIQSELVSSYSRGNGTQRVGIIKKTKAAKVIFRILAGFLSCWTPLYVVMLIDTANPHLISSYVYAGTTMLAFGSAAINCLIYSRMNKQLKCALLKILRLWH